MQVISIQESIAVTGTPQNLPNNPVEISITITASPTNSSAITLAEAPTVGYILETGFILDKGDSITVPVKFPGGNTNELWAIGMAGDTFSVVGM